MSPRVQGGKGRTVDQPTMKPTSKVTAATAAGALGFLVVLVLEQFGQDVSPEAAAAITTLLAFVGGYFKRESVVTREDIRARVSERGQTNVWFLLGALTVAVVVLAVVVLT